ncbi:MAG TPA: DUF192 domain-containing protein [Thermoanaerobaculia bacterium]
MRNRLFGPGLLVLATACGGAPQAPAAPPPTAASARGPAVVLPSGAVYRVEVARTPEEKTQGLMFRESLPERSGMIFLFTDAAPHQFWMKNTMVPLDIVWIDGSGRVVFVSANTPPCRADPCPSYGPAVPATNVLEIAGGMAAKEKVTVGSRIKIEGVQE